MHSQARTELPAASPGRALVERILATHHVEARRLLDQIAGTAAELSSALPPNDPANAIIHDCELLREEMLAHMAREEQVLFPLIIDLEHNGADEGDIGMLFSPIVCMKREHGFIDELLARLCAGANAAAVPGDAGDCVRRLVESLASFAAQTAEHVRIENDELFPLATALVPVAR